MARKATKNKKDKEIQQEIDKAAQVAAQLANTNDEDEGVMEETDSSQPFLFGLRSEQSDEEYAEDDVFEEAFKKAVALNTAPRYHIKKNSQFLAVKGWPYSWEQLQKEYGEGYYQVIAKSMSNGRILKKQSEMVGNPHGQGEHETETEESAQQGTSDLAYMTMMQQFQERADQKARESAKQSEGNMATLMQTIMSLQQQQSQMTMTMIQESNKQFQNLLLTLSQPKPDPYANLLTALITQKPQDSGLKPMEVIKLIEDAKKTAKEDERRNYEFMEKKAEQLADIKAEAFSSASALNDVPEKEESGLKGLIKGFVPVLTQILQQQQGQVAGVPQLAQGQRPIDQAWLDEQALKPTVGAAPAGAVPVVKNPAPQIKKMKMEVRMLGNEEKAKIFEAVSSDIGTALMNRVPASKTGEIVSAKLEKIGYARQTIAASYTLEDFYGYAAQYGLPEAVKPWLKEFHETLKTLASPKPVSEPAKGASTSFIPTNGTVAKQSDANVAAKRSEGTGSATGV